MARIDEVRENYEAVTNRLFSDKEAFADYLRFAGKFFKLPSAQSMLVYGSNPNAAMVADYETWKKFDRQVKRGTSSIAVLDNGNLKHYFDISQTAGSKTPYQWQLNKETAAAFIEEIFENEGKRFNSLSGCVNYLGSEKARESLENVVGSLNVAEENRAKFAKSYISMVQFFIAARCELGGSFKYNNKMDLTALDMLHSKAEKEKLCEFVQITGKSVLLSMEKSINNIILQGRSIDNGRNQTDMVRGRSDVLPRNQDGERQNVQVRPDDIRVSATVGVGSDGGRTGSDERGNREIRGEMAGVYDGKSPRGNTVVTRSSEMGLDTPTGGQGGNGVSGVVEETVREREPAPDNVQRADSVGEHIGNDNRQGDNGGHSADLSGISGDNGERATYSTTETEQTKAEDNTPAFSVDNTQNDLPTITCEWSESRAFEDGKTYSVYEFDRIMKQADDERVAGTKAALAKYGSFDNWYSADDEDFIGFMGYDKVKFIVNLPDGRSFTERQDIGDGFGGVIDFLSKDATYREIIPILEQARKAAEPKTESEKHLELPREIDKLYVNKDNESVTWVYYNPDSDKGGQLVYHHFTFDQLFDCLEKDDVAEAITHIAKTELVDTDDPAFKESARHFLFDRADFVFSGEWDITELSAVVEPTYSIFQLYEGRDDLRDYRFSSISELKKWGLNVERENYNRVYRGRLKDGETLEDLYTKFNIARPDDFRGHSLSISDIIAIKQDGKETAHYVDDWGFEEIHDFFLDIKERKTDREEEKDNIESAEQKTSETADYSDVIEAVRKGYFASITKKPLENENKDETTNIRLQYDGMQGGFKLLADVAHVKDAEIWAFGWNEQKVKDYLSQSAEKIELSSTRLIDTVDGTGYFLMEKPLTRDILAEIKKSCKKYIIAAPTLHLSEVFLNEHNITFLKLDRDISRDVFEKPSYEITIEMNAAVTRVIEDKATEILSEVRGGKVAEIAEPAEEQMIENARKTKKTNIRLTYNEKKGYHLICDTDTVRNAILRVYGENEQEVREDLRQYLNNYTDINLVEVENPIQFGLLGNGITVYDTSKWDKVTNDYPTIAHISNEGAVDYRVDKNTLKAEDISAIEKQAAIAKQEFTEDWENLSIDTRFSRIVDQANGLSKRERDIFFADEVGIGIEGIVKKYEHALIFRDEEFPAASKPLTAYRVGDFYELFNEDAHTAVELLNLTQTTRRGVPMVGFPVHAYEEYRRKLAFQGYYLNVGDEREIDKILSTEAETQTENETLEIAKKNISDFCVSEYGDEADFSDLHNIGIAYTAVESRDDAIILQVNADIIDCAIRYYVNDELYKEEKYPNLRKMNNEVLSALKFDELYSEFSDVVLEFEKRQTVEQAEQTVDTADLAKTEDKSDDKPTIVWEPVAASEYDGRIMSYSAKYDGVSYWITENMDGKFDIETLYGDQKISLGSDFEYFPSREEAEEFFDEIVVRSFSQQTVDSTPTKPLEALAIGDLVRGDGALWRISDIDDDFSISFDNTDKKSMDATTGFIGRWKEHFIKRGYEYVSPEEIIKQAKETSRIRTLDDLQVGDLVRGDGQLWEITDISGDFSMHLENTDKSSNLSEQSFIGKWKEQFIQSGYEYVLPSGLTLKQAQELNALAEQVQKAHQTPKTEEQEYYGEQLSLFGEPNHEVDIPKKTIIEGIDVDEALNRDLIQHGTNFADGKFRVAEYYYSHKGDTKDFAKMLGKEYGTGGHSGDGKAWLVDYNGKGITITIRLDNGEDTKVNWSWQKVANRIATLIDKQEYITQRDIDKRIKRAEYNYKHYEQGTPERERAEKILDEYGLLPSATTKLPDQQDVSEDKATAVSDDRTVEEKPTEQKATDKPVEIKNLAQLKRALTVGAEFEITSHIRPQNIGQLRRVNYADTTGIYSIRPDAPDDEYTTLANGGRGSYLDWGKASEWEFANDLCTLYQKDAEHTPENAILSFKVKPKVLDKEHSTDTTQDISAPSEVDIPPVEQAVEESTEVKLKSTVIDLQNGTIYTTDYQPPNTENVKRAEPHDFTITDEHLGEGGAKTKYAANIAAIRTLKEIEADNRLATPEEQEILSKYVGWGGLPQAFDANNKQWTNEYSELKELLTDEEYNAANASVLNAHYTTPTVIRAIYKGLENLGFEGGNILEPSMGVGNFFGAMPEGMRKNSSLSGVELDSISGRIAKQLYQTADIQVKGFEKTDFSDNFFDVAVGNVPFGNYPVSDKKYNRENFFIHNYFIAKSLDKVAPNGIVAVVTTKGTLDKENPKVREYLAKRADLIGAIRLPNNAFKANAGTEVTTDILFLQKREKMAVEMPDWCYVSQNADGVPVNNYFIEHPEMILGEMKQGMEFSMYGNSEETACVPLEGANLKEQLEKAVGNLKLNNALRIHKEQREKQAGVIPATADVRNFTFAEVDGKMYFRENNIMTEVTDKNGQPLSGKKLDRLKALNELRKTFRTILTEQENDCSDIQLQAYQKILNEQYDRFVKEYGYINDSANCQAFGKDDDYNSLCALEIVNEETKEVTKSDFFSRRTIKHYTEITHVDTPQEALTVSIDTYGKLDFEYMGKICDKEPQEVINALQADNLIYLNPNKADPESALVGWEETSEYLSGNVSIKLKDAELAAKDNPAFQRNVEALTAVIPKRIEAGDITARIGVHWVDVEDYQQFMEESLQVKLHSPLRRAYNGEYKIEHKSWNSSTAAININGTKRMNALEIFENLLNNRDVVVRDKIYDSFTGKERYEINIAETQKAQDKADKMKAAFVRWLWNDPERREKYVTRYNELFNSIVGRKYDGSHQTFPGMTPYIKLKPHQLDAVARAKFGGNTLLAHCVGAGKSFEMVAATMEKKRLGLINKACVVVPKSLVGQMANEWLRLYPQAKILTATEKDFDKDHRQKFIGRCCTGEYDAVIMSYEQFEKIPMSFEYRRDFIKREIDSLTAGISDLKETYRSEQENRGSIKDMERVKKRLEAKLEKLIEDNGKTKDTSLNFEQLGFDSLVVDEAHNYKNGLVVTKMNRVAGVQTTPAQKSEDILMKTQYLNETYGERNIFFATGTPVSNSMTELYIMKRYLRPSLLAQAGLQTFDDWASTFGEVVSKAELKPAGNGYRTKKRFAKFNNLPELMAMYKEFADIRTADMLDLPVPKIEGGKPQTIVATPNDFQVAAMQILAQRSEAVHIGAVEPTEDNMLKITGEARLLGLDARCLNPEADNYPDSKVNLCINKIMEIYTQTTPQKGVQAIFCDIAVNGDNEQEELDDGKPVKKQKTKIDTEDEGKFSVYNYIKAELIRRGIPKDEICFAGDADTQKKQNEMRAQLRSGTKRIVIASTSKLGTGANIQNKLVALHNLDIPWKPSDLEQRLGRIVRQGNENDTVQLYNYVTKDTFDAYMLNIIVTKQKFIAQLMSGNTTARSCEDVDEMVLNYTEMQALATGDPRIKEKIELDTDVARLKMLESEHYNEQYRLDDTINHTQIAIHNYDSAIEGAKKDVEFAKQNELPTDGFKVEIGGKVIVDRKEAGEALRKAAVAFLANANGTIYQPIGTFRGFELALEKAHDYLGGAYAQIAVHHEITYTTNLDIMGDIGNATRLENLVNDGIGKKLADMEKKCEQARGDLQAALDNKGKPFEHADELAQKSARLNQLNIELEVGKVDEVIMNESEDESRESPDRDTHDNDRGRPKPPSRGRH